MIFDTETQKNIVLELLAGEVKKEEPKKVI